MIHGLAAAIAVLLRFAFLFGIYYLIKGVLLLSGRRLPLRTGRHEQRRLGEMGCRRGESMPLLGGDPAPCFCKYLSFEDYSLYPGSAILCTADNRICEENKK